MIFSLMARHFIQKKYMVPGVNPNPKIKINSEFNSIHFGIEIKKHLQKSKNIKFLTHIFWV